jgi:sortase A
VLQVATGHIEGSSLPVGGKGSHCIISGHRGLPSAKLFTDLDRVKEGDVFILSALNEELTYEVDQITVVEAEDVSQLTFEDGKDLCTLVTCTPYGVNSHRLLVRGHRVPNETIKVMRVTSDATQIHRMVVTVAVCIPGALILAIFVFLRRKARR